MAEGRLLRQLIKAGSAQASSDFVRAAEEVIREERAKKHHLLASDLERMLYGVGASESRKVAREVPRDRERGLDLVEVREPVRALRDLVLGAEPRELLARTLLEHDRVEVLASYGLRPVTKLLFAGPPGCGKTSAAEALATELGRELVVVRVDAVVSSFLGETAANLGRVFEFLGAGRYVALFDEFDALGKEREDATEHGELRRVVNAFLQMLDAYRGRSILVAATNHERLLDRALWRRFDEVAWFEKPNGEQLGELLALKLRPVRHRLPLADRGFIAAFDGMSHADVERVVVRAIKAMALEGGGELTAEMVEAARSREAARQSFVHARV
jgi:SpoVK/Ycf46/Vps4 family AAA+-type ATPase